MAVLAYRRRARDEDEGRLAAGPPLLIIDPRPELVRHIAASLESYGYTVLTCTPSGRTQYLALELAAVVLGSGLAPLEVRELCEDIRRHGNAPLIVFLQDRSPDHLSLVLDAGADHCFIGSLEGTARLILSSIDAVRRRQSRTTQRSGVVEVGSLRIDIQRRSVELNGAPLSLTATEFGILALLAQRAGHLISAVAIVRAIHGYEADEAEAQDIVKVHISRLRQKLEADPSAPRCIVNVRGQGYMYVFERRGASGEQSDGVSSGRSS